MIWVPRLWELALISHIKHRPKITTLEPDFQALPQEKDAQCVFLASLKIDVMDSISW